MSNIRVTYSGLIAFLVGIVGVITGTIFTIIVTRQLTPEELGLWTLIGSLVSYVVIVEPIVSFWTLRQIARNEKVGKTSTMTSGLLSIGAFIAYIIISFQVSSSLKADLFPIILASTLVPLTFVNNTLSAIGISHKPQGVSYAIVSFEVTKLPFGFVFVYLMETGLVGAILATIFATLAKTFVLLYVTREKLLGSIKKEIMRFWFKLSWIPLYSNGSGFVFTLDVLIFSLITNSFLGLAFWGVANAVANMVGHAGQISHAVYPKIIATQQKGFAEENLKRLMFFAIPMVAGSFVFAKPALHILNPLYIEGVYIIYFLSIRTLINILTNFFYNIISAYETIDINKGASFRQYVKSKLFFIPTLNYIMNGSYIALLTIFLISIRSQSFSDVHVIETWSIILLAVNTPFMIYGLLMVQKKHMFFFPSKSILKLSIAAFTSSIITFFIQEKTIVYEKSIFDFLPQIIPLLIVGGLIYIGITYLIDKSTREFIQSIMKEIKSR